MICPAVYGVGLPGGSCLPAGCACIMSLCEFKTHFLYHFNMDTNKIITYLNELAPTSLAYEGEELGIIFGDSDKDVKTIGVTWRPTTKVLREAIENNVDLLITHEPLFQSKKSFLIDEAELHYPPNSLREELLKKGGISVYCYHSQWDDAEEGNNETLVKLFGMKNIVRIPYGRVGDIEEVSIEQLVTLVKDKLECENLLLVDGSDGDLISKIAVVAGSGNSLTEIIEIAKQKGADVLISGDVHDSKARFATELGLTLIDAGGYFTERPGMKRLYELLSNKFEDLNVAFLDPGAAWMVV